LKRNDYYFGEITVGVFFFSNHYNFGGKKLKNWKEILTM
jgi:hypothetical protein